MASEPHAVDLVVGVLKCMKDSSVLTLIASVCREDENTLELIAQKLQNTPCVVAQADHSTVKAEPGESKNGVKLEPTESKANDYDDATGAGRRKRKRMDYNKLRYQTCKECGKQFDITKNNDEACVWHYGLMTPIFTFAERKEGESLDDYDTFIGKTRVYESSEDESLEARTLERHQFEADMIKKHPEVFRYSCCYGRPLSRGCRKQLHVVKEL
ncbi:hypothetical protein BU16DRAFT_531132 [Lophium mytilinum]|uniref:Uncharacterized protein n=1 Tax=Lophium mytilinum TaxID=390894 RepID=A0A6A6QD61_9PEZI|nr:hypothetical protein BU16DRAFT_531132 [Lophium mytilinum]